MIWASAGLLLACSSCSKESTVGTDPEIPEGYGLLSMGISLNHTSFETRVEGGGNTNPGTPEENYVEMVRLVLYGYDDHKVKYAFDYKIRTRIDSDTGIPVTDPSRPDWVGFVDYGIDYSEDPSLYRSGSETHFVTYARKVEKQDYLMLLLINPTQSDEYPERDLYNITAVGKSLADFETAVSYTPSDAYGPTSEQIRRKYLGGPAEDNYFLMNNHRGLIWVRAEDLHTSINAANTNPVYVPVSRVVAKVQVTNSHPTTPPAVYVSEFFWDLDVTNKKTYWTRKLTNLLTENGAKGEMETYGPVPVINEKPSQSNPDEYKYSRIFLYAEDPNFSGLSNIGAPDPLGGLTGDARLEKLKEMRWNEFGLLEYPGFNAWDERITPSPDDFHNQLSGYGDPLYTYCLENTMDVDDQYSGVRTRVILRCVYVPDGYNPEYGYYTYKNHLLSPFEMGAYVSGSIPLPTELQGLIEDAAALKAATGKDVLVLVQEEGFEGNNIRFYYQGLNFYATDILHGVTPGYGQYGVLRNNLYEITFTSIIGPGSPVITNPEYGNLAVDIEIKKWYDRPHFTEL